MQVWKRRLAMLLAVGTGTVGLTLSSAGAQTSSPDAPSFPTITFPPPPTSPPPTSPPPTQPPSTSPPPTTPPPNIGDTVNNLLDHLLDQLSGEPTFEQLQQLIADIRADFFN